MIRNGSRETEEIERTRILHESRHRARVDMEI
jgi:hypothetical protein